MRRGGERERERKFKFDKHLGVHNHVLPSPSLSPPSQSPENIPALLGKACIAYNKKDYKGPRSSDVVIRVQDWINISNILNYIIIMRITV
jgi:hypothetical protein